jgi:lactoylglutathione lyase
MTTNAPLPRLNLLVLRAADLDVTLSFYRALGLSFNEEQHGKGPVHYACELDGLVLEIYPAGAGSAPERTQGGAVMLGLVVASLDQTLVDLGVTPVSPPKDSAWGRRAVVLDPDGRAVELSESK